MRVATCLVLVLLAAPLSAQQVGPLVDKQPREYRWMPLLDFVTPIAATFDGAEKGTLGIPGPLVNRFGYDNTTGMASVLYVREACFETWQAWPLFGRGAVIAVIQTEPRMFYLLHEDGTLKPEPQPQSAWCTPVIR